MLVIETKLGFYSVFKVSCKGYNKVYTLHYDTRQIVMDGLMDKKMCTNILAGRT